VVELELEAQFAAEICFGDLVDGVGRLQRFQGVQRAARLGGTTLVPFRAEVTVAVVDVSATDVGAEHWFEIDEGVDPGLRDFVDGAGRTWGGGHPIRVLRGARPPCEVAGTTRLRSVRGLVPVVAAP